MEPLYAAVFRNRLTSEGGIWNRFPDTLERTTQFCEAKSSDTEIVYPVAVTPGLLEIIPTLTAKKQDTERLMNEWGPRVRRFVRRIGKPKDDVQSRNNTSIALALFGLAGAMMQPVPRGY